MFEFISVLSQKHIKKIRFLVAGSAAALIEYGLFFLLSNRIGIVLFIANTVSFFGGLVVSFLLNKTWVFAIRGNAHRQFAGYLTLAMVNVFISYAIVWSIIEYLYTPALLAKIISMIIIAIWNFVIFSKIIFRRKEN